MIEDYLALVWMRTSNFYEALRVEVSSILYRVKIALDQVRQVMLFTCFLAGSSNRVYYLLWGINASGPWTEKTGSKHFFHAIR